MTGLQPTREDAAPPGGAATHGRRGAVSAAEGGGAVRAWRVVLGVRLARRELDLLRAAGTLLLWRGRQEQARHVPQIRRRRCGGLVSQGDLQSAVMFLLCSIEFLVGSQTALFKVKWHNGRLLQDLILTIVEQHKEQWNP